MTTNLTANTIRNAELVDIVSMLRDQHARKLDVVVPASQMRTEDGVLVLKGTESQLSVEGVTTVDGRYNPTAVFDEHLADRLGVPITYLRRLRREDRRDLFDANVNGLLLGRRPKFRSVAGGEPQLIRVGVPGDTRSFLVRAFRSGDGGDGVARALLSTKYARNDNLDALVATLDGIRAAGVDADVDGIDLTDRRMHVRISVPQLSALAPTLLKGYRSPFSGATGADNPTVFAGIVVQNSEVGFGAYTITPRLVVQVCNNGMTITKDALRAVHLGGRLDDGVIDWSADTERKNLDLIAAKTRDAVSTYLNVEYMQKVITELEEAAGVAVTKPADKIKEIGKALAYDQATIDGVLDHFIKGGQITAGGVMQAVTSFAQTLTDGDAAADLEGSAIKALEFAAR